MKRLTLVRHAQAESAFAEESDFERTLTRRGAEDAAEMARRFRQRKLHPSLILASTAVRATSTAEIFGRILRCQVQTDDRLYTAGPGDYLKVLRECDAKYAHVLVVAHNPGITEFADKLCSDRSIDAMPTCAIATMQLDIASWSELLWHLGTETDLDYPARAG